MRAPREADVVRAVLQYLSLRGILAFRVNSGAMAGSHKGKRWFLRFNGAEGCSDIIGVVPVIGGALSERAPRCGVFIAVEVKRPGGKLTEKQAGFLDAVRQAGGLAFCVDSVGALAKALDAEGL